MLAPVLALVGLALALLVGAPPVHAQGVGIFSRPDCTTITSPVAGKTWCFDTTASLLKVWNGTYWLTPSGATVYLDDLAVGDGVANDTTAVQNAVNISNVRRVACRSGTYLVDQITVPATLKEIAGPCTLKMRTGGQRILDVATTTGLSITGITLQGIAGATKVAAESGIKASGGSHLVVQGVTCTALRAFCAEANTMTDVAFRDNYVYSTSDAFLFNQVTRGVIAGNRIRDTSFTGNSPAAIQVGGAGTGGSTFSQDITIANNVVSGWGYESIFVYSAKRVSITGNVAENSQSGIQLAPETGSDVLEDVSIVGNSIYGATTAAGVAITGTCILVAQPNAPGGPAKNVTITGNTCRNANAYYQSVNEAGGIAVHSAQTVTIADNTILAPYAVGILLGGSGNTGITNLTVANNLIDGVVAVTGQAIGIYNPASGTGVIGTIVGNRVYNTTTGISLAATNAGLSLVNNAFSSVTTNYVTPANAGAFVEPSAVIASGGYGPYLQVGSAAAATNGTLDLVGSRTGSNNVVASIQFVNAAVGGAEKRLALIDVSRSGADNSGALTLYTVNAGTLVAAATFTPAGALSLVSALPVGSGGTGATTLTANGLLLGNGTSAVSAMAVCSTGTYVRGATGAPPICSTLVLPNAATQNRVVYATAANTYGESANVTYDGSTFTVAGRLAVTTTEIRMSNAISVAWYDNAAGTTNQGYINYDASHQLLFYTANTLRGYWGPTGGLVVGAPTGGEQGAGTINAAGLYYANGTAGQSATVTVRAAGGAADCTLIFTAGLKTGGTC